MKLSIITVVYNGKKTIENTINSVLSQLYKDFEYIVIDGGSSDGTREVIKQYENRITRVISERDEGVYDAMNKGVNMTNGEYICFLNSGDAFLHEDTLSQVVNSIEQNMGYDIYYGRTIVTFPKGNECWQVCGNVQASILSGKENYMSTGRISGDIVHQSIFATKKCFENNSFDIQYAIRAELDWYYSCIEKGYTFYNMNIPICRYTYGGISEDIQSIKKSINETRKIIVKHGYDSDFYNLSMENKYELSQIYKMLYSKWIELNHENKSISGYLVDIGAYDIAVYGYGELGTHLISDLKDTQIKVRYILDKDDKYEYQNIPCYKPGEVPLAENTDTVVITAIQFKNEIRETCNKLGYARILSLDEIIDDLLYK